MKLSSGVCFVLLGFVLLPLQYGESRTFKLGKWNWIISPSVYLQCNVFSPKWLQFLLFQFFFGGGGWVGREEKKKKEVVSRRCDAKECNPLQWNAHYFTILAKGQNSHRITDLGFVHFVSNIIFIVSIRIRWNMISAIIPFFPHIPKAVLPVGTLLYTVRLFP